MAQFPSSIPSYTGFTSSHTLSQDSHASQHNSEQGDITAIATKVGTGSSTPTNNTVLCGNGTGTSTWRALTGADVGLGNVPNNSLVATLQSVYPIGSIYIETTGVNPNTTFGFGVWALYSQGQVIVGYKSGDSNFGTAGATGGESTHTLSTTEIPGHNHTITDTGHVHSQQVTTSADNNSPFYPTISNRSSTITIGASAPVTSSTTGISINNAGGGGSHNNLQPFVVCYIWIRNS